MKVRRLLKKVTAVVMAVTLMLGSCMLASAETGTAIGGENATSETADRWCSLKGIEPLKAGETTTINVVANRTVYMNAFEIFITLADEKVEFASERASDANYRFMKSAYWNQPYGAACNYLEESKEVKMGGAGLDTEGVKAEAGEIIASFDIKAKEDLEQGDIVATLTHLLLKDEVLETEMSGDGDFGECVVVEKEEVQEESWCSLEGIVPLKDGETATINVVANKTVYMNSMQIFIKINNEKVEFASQKYDFFSKNFWCDVDKGICNYVESTNEVKMAAACPHNASLTEVTPGAVIASFDIKAKEDLAVGDVIATLTCVGLTDYVQSICYRTDEGNFGECVVKKAEPKYDYDTTEEPVISKEEIKNIVDENKVKDIIIKAINDIIFTFIQGTMEVVDEVENYDFSTVVNADYTSSNLPSDVEEADFVQKITYNHSGKLPGEANIKIFVGEKYNGTWLEYSELQNDNTLGEYQRVKADEEGYITVKQNHCSSYVITVSKSQEEPISGTCGENLTWTLDSNGKITISGSGELSDCLWYSYKENIKKVDIKEGVTKIGNGVFQFHDSLEEVIIPEGVTEIGDHAFESCSNLEKIVIPQSVTVIGKYAFSNTKWITDLGEQNPLVVVNHILIDGWKASGKVVIPEGITSIAGYAFRLCDEVTEVVIPKGVTQIGEGAFAECHNLEKVTLPESITSIGSYAFMECTKMEKVIVPDGITSIGGGAFEYCASLEEVVLPNKPISIGQEAFYDTPWFTKLADKNTLVIVNGNLISVDTTAVGEKITIPNGVTSIADSAFYRCGELIEVSIPKTVSIIGNHAFANCEKLTDVVIPEGVTRIENGTFYGCKSLEEIIIPDSVTYIGLYAFSYCNLQEVKLGEGLNYIGNFAFAGNKMTEIDIPENVRTIDYGAFKWCGSLEKAILHEGIIEIGEQAFAATNLKEITIPASVSEIGDLSLGILSYEGLSGEVEKVENFKIYGTEDSASYKYAIENGFAFELLKEPIVLSEESTQISATDIATLVGANNIQDIIINNPDGIVFRFKRGTMKQVEGKEAYDFGVEFITDYSQMESPDFAAEEFALGISFNYSGELPGTAKITIPVDNKWVGQTLYYYEVLEDGTYMYTGQNGIVGEDGTITVSQNHCSKYVLLTKPSVTFGDVNGDSSITAEDALAILKHVVGLEELTGDALTSADVNVDSAITAEDALDVLKKVVGLIDKFVAEA